MIAIVDYGVGNLASIGNMLRKIGASSVVTSDEKEIARAEKLILPGVGSFDYGMQSLEERGLTRVLNDRVIGDGVPVLGICLGVQLFTRGSDEGQAAGLGWIPGRTVRFDRERLSSAHRIPYMGWANVEAAADSRLLCGLPAESRFYFVHSYHLQCEASGDVIAFAVHGYPYPAAVERDNVIGVQFHPEKSHRFGMALLKNFVERY